MLRRSVAFFAFFVALACDHHRRADSTASAPSLTTTSTTTGLAAGETLVVLPTSRGVKLPFLLDAPSKPPTIAIVLLAGSDGALGLSNAGIAKGSENFVVRTRARYVTDGFVVVVPDAPSDRPQGLEGFRTSAEHARDLGDLVAWLKDKYHAPVWMVGTSRGTISAANASARLDGDRAPSGIVLTSSVSVEKKGKESLLDVALDRIALPVLLVHHREDGCGASPFSGVATLKEKLVHATPLKFVPVEGGSASGAPCGPLHHHGFEGIESSVIETIERFVEAPK
jgi:hypothetical protein